MKIEKYLPLPGVIYIIVENATINDRLIPFKQYLVVGETKNRYRVLINEIKQTHAIVAKKQVKLSKVDE